MQEDLYKNRSKEHVLQVRAEKKLKVKGGFPKELMLSAQSLVGKRCDRQLPGRTDQTMFSQVDLVYTTDSSKTVCQVS